VIADLVGKSGHVRTVPIPTWVKSAVDAWTAAAAITHGRVFRAINKAGRVCGDGMSPKVLWDVVRAATWLAANWTRSSFCSATSPSRPRSVTRMQAEAPVCRERPMGNRT